MGVTVGRHDGVALLAESSERPHRAPAEEPAAHQPYELQHRNEEVVVGGDQLGCRAVVRPDRRPREHEDEHVHACDAPGQRIVELVAELVDTGGEPAVGRVDGEGRAEGRARLTDLLRAAGQLGLQRQGSGVIGTQRQRLAHPGPCPSDVVQA